jgi:predicted enzyme related to lactoylglutathione lyase
LSVGTTFAHHAAPKRKSPAMPVELGYFTLKVKDVARAKVFYGALFGWEFEDGGHVRNTRFPMGLSGGGPIDISFAYFRVDDLEQILARLPALGGTVLGRETYPSGPNAKCADDQGMVFVLWQPAPGFE